MKNLKIKREISVVISFSPIYLPGKLKIINLTPLSLSATKSM